MDRIGAHLLYCLLLLASASISACRKADGATRISDGAAATDEGRLSRQELLGKRLFEDASLSEPPGVSCRSCHDPARAFVGDNGSPIAAVARGSRAGVLGALGERNTPTIFYASFAPPFAFAWVEKTNTPVATYEPVGGLFWDGRANTLAEQAKGPILNAREMNNASPSAFVKKVRAASYAPLAREILGASLDDDDAAWNALALAIAAFESTPRFHPFRSKFDGFLRGERTLSEAEARGFRLFKDPEKGNCISCHAGKVNSTRPEDWLFTDFTYSALGVPRNTALPDNKDAAHFDLGLCKRAKMEELAPGGTADRHCGEFRVPTLRNVAVTAPYMHNGAFSNLYDVVRFYVTRDTNPARWYPTDLKNTRVFNDLPFTMRENISTDEVPYDRRPGESPRLSEDEVADVVAFLRTLTDE